MNALIDVFIINMLFLSSITLIVIFFALIVSGSKVTNSWPPCPPRLPIIGNLHQLGRLPHRSLQALSNKYGPIMLLCMGSVPTVIISSQELACEVLKTHDLIFSSRPPMSIPKVLLYGCDIAFEPLGEYWRKIRKICVIHLLNTQRVQSFAHIRQEEVSLMVSKIRSSQNGVINLSEQIMTLTNGIVCRAALGKRYHDGVGGVRKLKHMLSKFFELLGSFPITDYIPWLAWLDCLSGLNSKVRENRIELDDFLEVVLEEHTQARRCASSNKENCDFVDLLQSFDGKNQSASDSLSRDSIKAVILDMFVAGTETTFTVLEWTMAELLRRPKMMIKAQEEVRGIVGGTDNVSIHNISDNDVNRMTYLKATIKETLRMHPPLPLLVPRETTEDVKLKGYHIPKGTRVIINAWAIGRDPSSWENPEEFDPDRFINCSVDFKGQDFQLIPFGGGRRMCPGISFSVLTIQLALANLLLHFDWELPRGLEKEALDMSEAPGITVHKKSGLALIAKEWIA